MEEKLHGNIAKYAAFEFLVHFEFYTPVFVIFLISRGITLTQAGFIFSIHSLGALLFDLPGGVFADRFSKKSSLVIGSLLWGLALLAYAYCTNFWQFAAAAFIGGIGQAFMSGADRALIHETLKSLDRENDYKKIEGRIRGVNEIVVGLGVFLGGIINTIGVRLPLILSSVFIGMSSASAMLFENPTKHQLSEKPTAGQIFTASIQILRSSGQVLWLVIYFAVFTAFIWASNILAQPYLTSLGVPTIYFGFIFSAFSILYALSSAFVHRVDKYLGKSMFVLTALIVSLAMFLVGSIPHPLIFLLWAIFGIFETANWTLVSSEILKIVPKAQATTLLSFQSLTLRSINILISPMIGFMADKVGVYHTLQLNGMILMLFLVVLIILPVKFSKV